MDDWQVGDLALCVGPLDPEDPQFGMRLGGIYTVTAVIPSLSGLLFQEVEVWGGFDCWQQRCFRKIAPHRPDAEDAETIALLQGAPVPEVVF